VSVSPRWARVADLRQHRSAAVAVKSGREETVMASPNDEGSTGTDRPAGTVDEDANPPLGAPGEFEPDTADERLPQDAGESVPPYEGRQTSAKE
jgi:hypothetical protein